MNISRLTVALMVVLLLGSSCLFGLDESGQISGTVKDLTTGAALPGASIWLKGTSFGASTNLNGLYVIPRVPPGSYTLVVRFIGYVGKEIEVEVKPGSTLEQNSSLLAQAVEGQEVVVTVQRKGQEAAINQQLSANTITSVVSAEKIHELPDASAAAALARLPGVSLQSGDEVVVRGVQAKMNQILLNGVRLPSTDMYDRSVNLGFISSNMLSGIQVVKAITPDMDANAIGGVVNLTLREAPENLHFEILAQGEYNAMIHNHDNFKSWISASDRFFDNKLGVFLQGTADRGNVGNDRASVTFAKVGDAPYGQAPYQTTGATFTLQDNQIINNGATLVLDYALPNGKIVFQNSYAHNSSNLSSLTDNLSFTSPAVTYALQRNSFGRDLWINGLQATNDFGDFSVELNVSHSATNKYTDISYGMPGDNMTFGNGVSPRPYGLNPDGTVKSYQGNQADLTLSDAMNIWVSPTDMDSSYFNGWVRTHNESFTEHIYNVALDVTVPVTFSSDVSGKIKAGGKVLRSTREDGIWMTFKGTSDPDLYGAHVKDMFPGKRLSNSSALANLLVRDIFNPDYKRGSYFLNGTHPFLAPIDPVKYDLFMIYSQMDWNPKIYWPGVYGNGFNGAELFTAGYLMGTFDIGSKLTVLGGVRYEQYNMVYKANFDYVTHGVYGDAFLMPEELMAKAGVSNRVDRTDQNVFPNAQVRYKINDWSDVRVAFTKGISRPDYLAILPNIYFEPGISARGGNSNLKPAISTNYDLALSFYSNVIGLFTIAPFYKRIESVFYSSSIYFRNLGKYDVSFPDSVQWATMGYVGKQMPDASQLISCYINNPNPARVQGFELEWQTNFWYLPHPLNSLVLSVNYTKAWSDMDYQQEINTAVPYKSGRFTLYNYITTDTIYNTRLVFQPNDVLNVAFGIDYEGFSGRISFNLQGNVITAVGTRPEEDQFTGNIYRWDFTLQQKLPIDGLSIAFSGTNIFNNPVYTYQDFRRAVGGPIIHNEQSVEYSPRTFQANLRYSF